MAEGGKVRISVGFPEEIYEKLEQMAKRQHRTVASVVVEASDRFIDDAAVREATVIAEQSPEYRAISEKLDQLRKDMGLPPNPPHKDERDPP